MVPILSKPGELWCVHWDQCNKLSNHKSTHSKFLSDDHSSDYDYGLMLALTANCEHIGGHEEMIKWTKNDMANDRHNINDDSITTADIITINKSKSNSNTTINIFITTTIPTEELAIHS